MADIKKQIEFYFSDANLSRDKFLQKELAKTKNQSCPVSLFLKFKRIQSMTENVDDILEALKKSTRLELVQNEEGVWEVKRKVLFAQPKAEDLDQKTAFVWGWPSGAFMPLEQMEKWFKEVAKVNPDLIKMKVNAGKFEGAVWAMFDTKEEAEAFCEKENVASLKDGETKIFACMKQTMREQKKVLKFTAPEITVERVKEVLEKLNIYYTDIVTHPQYKNAVYVKYFQIDSTVEIPDEVEELKVDFVANIPEKRKLPFELGCLIAYTLKSISEETKEEAKEETKEETKEKITEEKKEEPTEETAAEDTEEKKEEAVKEEVKESKDEMKGPTAREKYQKFIGDFGEIKFVHFETQTNGYLRFKESIAQKVFDELNEKQFDETKKIVFRLLSPEEEENYYATYVKTPFRNNNKHQHKKRRQH